MSSLVSSGSQLSNESPKIPIIVVPGIMGSRLQDSNGKLVWDPEGEGGILRKWTTSVLQDTRNELFPASDMPADPADPDSIQRLCEVIASCYEKLCIGVRDQLTASLASHRPAVYCSGYDWRRSVDDNALENLAVVVNEARDACGGEKVILIAHSMGGLVARYYCKHNEDAVEALFLLASPSLGAVQPFVRLKQGVEFGPDDFVTTMLTKLMGLTRIECREFLRAFPGLYEIAASPLYFAQSPAWLTFDASQAGYPLDIVQGAPTQSPPAAGHDLYRDLFVGLTEKADSTRERNLAIIDVARRVHDELTIGGKAYMHPQTYCAYCDDIDTQVACDINPWGRVLQTGSDNYYAPNMIGAPTGPSEPQHENLTLTDGGGDGAVPAISACPGAGFTMPFAAEPLKVPGAEHAALPIDDRVVNWVSEKIRLIYALRG